MKKLDTQCLGILNLENSTESSLELFFEALDDYKLSKKGGSKCQHTINPDTIG